MIITIASDHGGYQYKEDIDSYLREQGHEVINLGCYSEQSCLLYTSPSPRDLSTSRMPSSA